MSFQIGITGLPNVGKSTLFSALTKQQVDISNYPFCTVEPNLGPVKVPDPRLKQIAEVVNPEKTTPTVIQFVDIAGLVKKAHQGQGLGNQFLAHLRECDAILEVIRCFENKKIEHVETTINPERDIEIVKTELLMKDLQITAKALTKLSEKSEPKKLKLLNKIKQALSKETLISELNLVEDQLALIKGFQFLTLKPIIYLFNVNDKTSQLIERNFSALKELLDYKLALNLKLEQEISELSQQGQQELNLKSNLDQLISECYNTLDLITFYTITGGKETRAWTLTKGEKCSKAGGVVHSDFEQKFKKAEVLPWKELIPAGSWHQAKQKGLVKTVGKDYVVQDGDIIEFKI